MSLEKEILFDKMKPLIAAQLQYYKTRNRFLTGDELEDVKNCYKQIAPWSDVNMGCPSCVTRYLDIILSWYEREYPKWLKEQGIEIPPATDEDIVKADRLEDEKAEQAKVKLSRAEILAKARAAKKIV